MITVFVVNDSLCLSPQEGSSSIKHVARGPQLEQDSLAYWKVCREAKFFHLLRFSVNLRCLSWSKLETGKCFVYFKNSTVTGPAHVIGHTDETAHVLKLLLPVGVF